MSAWLPRLALCALAVAGCAAPTASEGPAAAASGATSLASRSAVPPPTSLPDAAEQLTIVQALASAGGRVDRVYASKFDWLFGSASPRSALFDVTSDGRQSWVDVHFFARVPGAIVACSGAPMTSKAGTFSVAVDGRPEFARGSDVTGSFSSGTMYFASSDRYFAMTPDMGIRDVLARSLGLTTPDCREPVTLPVLPWEREVVSALKASGLAVSLVAGSKWESFDGIPREARLFRWSRGDDAGAADVLSLGEPYRDVRVCSTPTSPGYTRTTITVNGRAFASDGTLTMHPLVGSHFFVFAWDAPTADALRRGLGISMPPC